MSLPNSLSMNRLLALVPAAVLLLSGCGDACTSQPAPLKNTQGASCSLAPGVTANIQVELCGKCSDSGASCQAEFTSNRLEVAPTVQQCQASSGCAEEGCSISVPMATCQVTLPASLTPGATFDLNVIGDTTVQGTLTVGSETSCTL